MWVIRSLVRNLTAVEAMESVPPDGWGATIVASAASEAFGAPIPGDAIQDDQWPPGFQFGRTMRLEEMNPNSEAVETLYDAEGALRMRTCSKGVKWHFSGPRGQEHLSRCVGAEHGIVCCWTRVRGEPQEVRRDLTDAGWRCFFTDYRGGNRWCKVRCVHKSGREVHYEGEWKQKWLRMVITPNKNVLYFEGDGVDVHKVRTYTPPIEFGRIDAMTYFDESGDVGRRAYKRARAVRMVFSDGRVRTLAGEAGKERIAKTTYPSGVVQEFEGERGKERLVRQTDPNGDVGHYVGPKGVEHLHRIVEPGGAILLFLGERGNERLFTVINLWGNGFEGLCDVTMYHGEKGEERRKRRLNTQTGAVEVFTGGDPGLQNNEACNKKLIADGRLATKNGEFDGWVIHEDNALAAPAIKRQRVKEKAHALWSELEALSEGSNVKEQALIEMGVHFQALRAAVDECVA